MNNDFLWRNIIESVARIDTIFRRTRTAKMSGDAESGISIDSSSIVCAEAEISGEVTIKEGCVVQPFVTFDATKGPIFVGKNNIFEEFSVIRNNSDGQPMIIGDSNIFQSHSKCHAKYVGSRNVVGIHAILEDGCSISDDCSIPPRGKVHSHQNLEPSIAVYGEFGEQRSTKTPNLNPNQQLEFLRKVLPSYHHLYGGKKRPVAVPTPATAAAATAAQ